MNDLNVIVEEVEIYPRKYQSKRKNIEITNQRLWESPEMVFSQEDEIPPDKWDYQKRKVK